LLNIEKYPKNKVKNKIHKLARKRLVLNFWRINFLWSSFIVKGNLYEWFVSIADDSLPTCKTSFFPHELPFIQRIGSNMSLL
jgi:hypothetical protein